MKGWQNIMKMCSKCGFKVVGELFFCSNCGANLIDLDKIDKNFLLTSDEQSLNDLLGIIKNQRNEISQKNKNIQNLTNEKKLAEENYQLLQDDYSKLGNKSRAELNDLKVRLKEFEGKVLEWENKFGLIQKSKNRWLAAFWILLIITILILVN